MRFIVRLLVFFALVNCLEAQKLRIVRTDTDSTRAGFITAGNLFGIDIYYEGIENLNRIVFDVEYNNIVGINYSGWRSNKPSEEGYVMAIPMPDSLNNVGLIGVVAVAGDPLKNAYFKRNNIIHFDFVVSQNVAHSETIRFQIKNIQAYIWRSSTDSIITFEFQPIIYQVHGYVDVWPGDANNDGVVDLQDIHQITQMLGYGAEKNNSRTYKRHNASTLWYAQKVLAWDNEMATFSDCDGNGAVTIKDMLVVQINIRKTHSAIGKIFVEHSQMKRRSGELLSGDLMRLNIAPIGNIKAIVGRVFCDELDVVDVVPKLLNYSGEINFYWNKVGGGKELVFFVGTDVQSLVFNEIGEVVDIICANNEGLDKRIDAVELYGLGQYGEIFPIGDYYFSKVESGKQGFEFSEIINDNVFAEENLNDKLKGCRIYNYLGQEVHSIGNDGDWQNMISKELRSIAKGRYYLVLIFADKVVTKPIIME